MKKYTIPCLMAVLIGILLGLLTLNYPYARPFTFVLSVVISTFSLVASFLLMTRETQEGYRRAKLIFCVYIFFISSFIFELIWKFM